jgi:hypothetical protein
MFQKGWTLSVMLCEAPSRYSSESFCTVLAWKHDEIDQKSESESVTVTRTRFEMSGV